MYLEVISFYVVASEVKPSGNLAKKCNEVSTAARNGGFRLLLSFVVKDLCRDTQFSATKTVCFSVE